MEYSPLCWTLLWTHLKTRARTWAFKTRSSEVHLLFNFSHAFSRSSTHSFSIQQTQAFTLAFRWLWCGISFVGGNRHLHVCWQCQMAVWSQRCSGNTVHSIPPMGQPDKIQWLGLGTWESHALCLAVLHGSLASFGQVNPGCCALTLPNAEQITGMTFAKHSEN